MRLLFLAKRWHLWRHRLASSLLGPVSRLAQRLARIKFEAGTEANALHDKARMRLAICERCPLFDNGWCNRKKGGCGCWLIGKVQIDGERCPLKRW